MDINWLETALYGIVSGITEFLPVSAQAHQRVFLSLFGLDGFNPLLNLFSTLGMLAAIMVSSGASFRKMYREYSACKGSRHRRKRIVNMQSVMDINLVKMACIPLIVGIFVYLKSMNWRNSMPLVAVFSLVNCIILHIPMYLTSSNKDSRNMSALDGVLVGIGAMLSVFPGVSRIGAVCSFAAVRGADSQQAFKWSLMISIPALIGMILFDAYAVLAGGLSGVGIVFILKCILCAVMAYVGSSLSIALMKTFTQHARMSGFSYYSLGVALFIFILYLY